MDQAIAAIATGTARSAVGVIRLSGEGCIQAVARVFSPDSGRAFGSGGPGRLTLGTLRDREGATLDRALAVYFSAPRSYTGEDACELHCHGSPAVLALALEALYAQGIRPAEPGGFTRRAFLNGKLDLVEAEAVADLIAAPSPSAARCAAAQLGGALSKQVEEVYDGLIDLMAHFHAALDYPDEDIAPFTDKTVQDALDLAGERLKALADSYDKGRYIKEGVPTAIVGRPNVGKSSLLNALVGYDRAIVTDVPGTTRDTVEETCRVGETLLRLTDTAGLRDTVDAVERQGVARSRRAMEEAALILAVVDLSRPVTAGDVRLLREVEETGKPWIFVASKKDLVKDSRAVGAVGGGAPASVAVSAKTGEGLDALAKEIGALFPAGAEGEVFFTNARQAAAAQEAVRCLGQAVNAPEEGMPPDGPLSDVELAMAALGELTGRNIQEDVVDRIFSRFCVGK